MKPRQNISRTWKNAVKYTKVLCDEEIGCGCGQAIDNCDEDWGRNEGSPCDPALMHTLIEEIR
mgnify:CR=1 FL=1